MSGKLKQVLGNIFPNKNQFIIVIYIREGSLKSTNKDFYFPKKKSLVYISQRYMFLIHEENNGIETDLSCFCCCSLAMKKYYKLALNKSI